MRISIIDAGTNTFKLIIAKINGDNFQILDVVKRGVQLGKDSYRGNKISEAAFARAEECLLEFINIASSYDAPIKNAFATAVVRDAGNGEDFLRKVKEKTGITMQTISGRFEAELIMKGVISALPQLNGPVVIMDIGGGSTEFVYVKDNEMIWSKSFPLGASRLLQKLSPSDPVSQKDIRKLYDFLNDELSELKFQFADTPLNLIGSSGSFETFADMIALEINKEHQKPAQTAVRLDPNDLHELIEQLIRSNHGERIKMNGLPFYRVDTIVFSGLMTRWFINNFQTTTVWTSYRSMKEGVIADLIDNQEK
ncbi:MAG: hypothetical protein K9J21_07965 [Bacteroidales bacterium]|nr:hypothetical protein [Bacteroidales bacterium]